MPRYIHTGPGGYREWSTVTDTYLTHTLTRVGMVVHLGEECADRLDRADAHGTSRRDASRDASSWEAERCQQCVGFHHSFEGDGVRCTACGEPTGDRQHRPPCQATETAHPIKGDFEFELTPLFKDINALLSERERLLETIRLMRTR